MAPSDIICIWHTKDHLQWHQHLYLRFPWHWPPHLFWGMLRLSLRSWHQQEGYASVSALALAIVLAPAWDCSFCDSVINVEPIYIQFWLILV
uniref:Uncharacterized protein n=1 Tax=Picea glauca TaxID=3330 RepID=A0A101M3W7_PICGL|nr:hypothetical protein ABT39_MTgene290 [Picea glauca]QHR90713.1 hypothetical protein Q903MT_gene4739 [Picea sitchensis]